MTTLEIPRMSGTRQRAEIVASALSDDLSSTKIEIDADLVASASQSFADELCKQILVDRSALSLTVHNASPWFANYLSTSARLRSVTDRLSVDVKP
jgi:hypothetical protein